MSSFLVCDTNCSEEQTIKKAYFLYDAAGCVTAIDRDDGPDLDLTWNGQYQLTSVSTNGVVAESYTYDPLGRRFSTTSGGTTLRHVYNGIHCVADIDSVGSVVKSYTWGPGVDNLLAVTCHSGPLATTYYALTDLQGTVHGFADAGGNLVARYAYDAWGNLLDADVAVSALADNRFLFQGREYSWATGLTNFRLRWYDPATGRWLSKDPIGISGGLNLYAFCGNDPVNYVDPWGLCEEGLYDFRQDMWEQEKLYGGITDMSFVFLEYYLTGECIGAVGGKVLGWAGGKLRGGASWVGSKFSRGGSRFWSRGAERAESKVLQISESNLQRELQSLRQTEWELRGQLDNGRNQAARILDNGGVPNPHGLGREINETIPAQIRQVQDQIRRISDQMGKAGK